MLMLISSFFSAHRTICRLVIIGEWCLWLDLLYTNCSFIITEDNIIIEAQVSGKYASLKRHVS